MQITSTSLSALFTGFNAAFQSAFDAAAPQFQNIAMVVPSTTSMETYPWLGAIPGFREWLGDRVINNLKTHDFSLKNKSFENTIGVKRDDISDDKFGVYQPMFAELGRATAIFPDQLVFGLLPKGNTQLCYDGQYFFDTDHPVIDEAGVTQSVSNDAGGAGTPWYLMDLSRSVKPMIFQDREKFNLVRMDAPTDMPNFSRKDLIYGVDGRCNAGFGLWQLAFRSRQPLTAANYAAARAAMGGFKADGGRPLGIVPTHLVVAPSLEGAANTIINSALVAGGETNPWAGTAKLLMTPYLA